MNPAMLNAIDGVLEWAIGYSNTPSVMELRAQRDQAVELQEALLDKVATLAPKQKEIAIILAKGYTSNEVADMLGLSPKTIDAVRATVFKRLGVDSVAPMAVMLYRAGLLGEGEP